jgi:hypothetical protein
MRIEHRFFAALEHLGSSRLADLSVAKEHVNALVQELGTAGLVRSDPRGLICSALLLLDLDEAGGVKDVPQLGRVLKQTGAKLEPWQRQALEGKLERLLRYEDFAAALR